MPPFLAQISWPIGDSLPENRVVMTPHFDVKTVDPTTGPDYSALASDLATAIKTWETSAAEVRVKLYRDDQPAPNFPVAESVRNTGVALSANIPRELALCLSFYSERNLPRRRGRLYVPAFMLGLGTTVGLRPTEAARDKVAALVPILTGLGGINVDWCVWSTRDSEARPVTNWFIDDEWDIQRRRGLRSSNRRTGTTTEASAP